MGMIYRYCNIAFEYEDNKYFYINVKTGDKYGPFDTEKEMKDSFNENIEIINKGVNYGK